MDESMQASHVAGAGAGSQPPWFDVPLKELAQTTLDAFNVILIHASDTLDEEAFALKLNLERARLWAWCSVLGGTRSSGIDARFREKTFQEELRNELNALTNMFKYNLHSYGFHDDRRLIYPAREEGLSIAATLLGRACNNFHCFNIRSGRPMGIGYNRWLYQGLDGQTMDKFFEDIRYRINWLHSLTEVSGVPGQPRALLEYMIQRIGDHQTLERIADIAEQEGYNSIAAAALLKIDIMGLGSDAHITDEITYKKGDPTGNLPIPNFAPPYQPPPFQPPPGPTTTGVNFKKDATRRAPSHRRDNDITQSDSSDSDRKPMKKRPTWLHVKYKYLDPLTLDLYKLPWHWHPSDKKCLVIRTWVNETDQEILFEHSRKLRESKKSPSPATAQIPQQMSSLSLDSEEDEDLARSPERDSKRKSTDVRGSASLAERKEQAGCSTDKKVVNPDDTNSADGACTPPVIIDHE